MKRNLFSILFLITSFIIPQGLTGKKICLDPGHGFIPGQAYVCNDAETKRFESYINHYVIPQLKKYLQSVGVNVKTTRVDYDSVGPCITLTERKAIANNFGADFFHSVHHNAFQGTTNYSLSLFKQLNSNNCPNGNPAWPGQADVFSNIAASRIYNALQTPNYYNRGDLCFLGFNLGVLSTLAMPGTLSEGSFFDFPEEILRLKNVDYLQTEAEAIFHAFLQYYNHPFPAHGSLVGFITNSALNKPAKAVKVSIESLNKHYTVDFLGNGFYRLDSIAPGTYTIKVASTTDTTISSVTITGGTINKKNLSVRQVEPVSDVKITIVLSSTNSITPNWLKPQGTADSIRIFLSSDGENWDSIPTRVVPGNLTSSSISGLESNKAYYVRIRAKNTTGESPNYSKVYGAFTSNSTDKILLVDGFNNTGTGSALNKVDHNIAAVYGNLFAKLGRKFETVNNSVITLPSQLPSYKTVFWFVGDESFAEETFTTAEQNLIKPYLQGGGNLFVCGSNIAYDLGSAGSSSDRIFMNQYFMSNYAASNPTPNLTIANGVQQSIFDSITTFSFGNIYAVASPDVITTLNGSVSVLEYNSTQSAAVAYQGLFPSGTKPGSVIFSAIPVETIVDTNLQLSIIQKSLEYFATVSGVEDENLIPKNFSVSIFPNPFNPSTIIEVNIFQSDKYSIEVYNLLGEKVVDLFSGELTAGTSRFSLEMNNFPTGTYFVKIASAENIKVHKILLMK